MKDGTLLTFCEGRSTPEDPGRGGIINISFKRSTDGARSWSPVRVLASSPAHAYSDPRVLYDSDSNSVFLIYTQWPRNAGFYTVPAGWGDNSSILYMISSTDAGLTWSGPRNLNPQLKKPSWYAINAGVGSGIQLKRQTASQGGHNGRLIFPAILRDNGYGYDHVRNASIYSDDQGRNWRMGTPALAGLPGVGSNEAAVVELESGVLFLSSRTHSAENRYHYLSCDGGESWERIPLAGLRSPRINAGILYIDRQGNGGANRLLISVPLGTPAGSFMGRSNLGIWISNTEGTRFARYAQIVDGYSSYSQMVQLPDGRIGVIYESEQSRRISFLSLTLSDLISHAIEQW